MSRTILVEGEETYRVTVPDNARFTFGPWSPPSGAEAKSSSRWSEESKRGTLRVYEGAGTTKILAVFTGVRSFRDISTIGYSKQVLRESGPTIWQNDDGSISREAQGFQENDYKVMTPALDVRAGRARRSNGAE